MEIQKIILSTQDSYMTRIARKMKYEATINESSFQNVVVVIVIHFLYF